MTGTAKVETISERDATEPVYNIEVDGDHVYRVGESGVLVHNLSQKVKIFSEKYFGGNFCTPGGPIYTTGSNGRAEKAEARVCNTGGGSEPIQDPVGWKPEWNQGLPKGHSRVARCHLLGNQLGGAGTADNLVPCCQSKNLEMAAVENRAAAFIVQHGCADIEVIATYNTPGRKIPSSITFKAVAQDSKTRIGTTFSITVNNPNALTDCPVL